MPPVLKSIFIFRTLTPNVNTILFSTIFTGTACIIMAAPSHYDSRKPIDVLYSKIDLKSDLMTMLKNTGREDFFDQQE